MILHQQQAITFQQLNLNQFLQQITMIMENLFSVVVEVAVEEPTEVVEPTEVTPIQWTLKGRHQGVLNAEVTNISQDSVKLNPMRVIGGLKRLKRVLSISLSVLPRCH